MKFIRKITIGLLVISLAVVISACGTSDEDKTDHQMGIHIH